MSVGASDIHVEPQQKGLRLRFRQDGVLQQYVEPLPSRFGEKVCLHLLDSGATLLGLDSTASWGPWSMPACRLCSASI